MFGNILGSSVPLTGTSSRSNDRLYRNDKTFFRERIFPDCWIRNGLVSALLKTEICDKSGPFVPASNVRYSAAVC